jgi:hypothetical protein
MLYCVESHVDLFWLDWTNSTRTTERHTVVTPDDGPRYARNMYRLKKYTKNIKLVFLYTISSSSLLFTDLTPKTKVTYSASPLFHVSPRNYLQFCTFFNAMFPNSTLGLCKAVPYANHTAATVQNSAIHNRRAAVRFQLHATQWFAHSVCRQGDQPIIPPLPTSAGEPSKRPRHCAGCPSPYSRTGSLHLGPCIRALCAPHCNSFLPARETSISEGRKLNRI